MTGLNFYVITDEYVKYLHNFDNTVVENKDPINRYFDRKYIGVVFELNEFKYFAPLSSFKNKHRKMKEAIDFIKIGTMAVINLNNMIPVPEGEITYCNIEKQDDMRYRQLLRNEYDICKHKENHIIKNAKSLYNKVTNYNSFIAERCCDFKLLEDKCREWSK
ncbi:MAG: hypothetical protein A2Y24_00115 [Clostridiales bacterium GWE2_32_10]|nr:MAG: hypothetical protein A2Y24_00115 [Clostridiales bacterium GWE2_32_10]